MRSLTSASSHLSRFTVLETSPVNEELQKNFSGLFMQQFTRWKRYTGKRSYIHKDIHTLFIPESKLLYIQIKTKNKSTSRKGS